jgi:hypothetical protein
MVIATLNRLLIDTVEDSISTLHGRKENIEQERFIKLQQYKKKKNEYIDSHLTSTMLSSRENLEKWHDKFTDYSSMGFLSCKQYWKSLCDLGYKFAQGEYTDVHVFIFYCFCSKQPKMTLDQYMVSILALRNEIPTLLNRYDMLRDILIETHRLDTKFKQIKLSYSYKATINEREFIITPEIFYEIICEINCGTNEFHEQYLSIFLQLFYW